MLRMLVPLDAAGNELSPVVRTVLSADAVKPVLPRKLLDGTQPPEIAATQVRVVSGDLGVSAEKLIVKGTLEDIFGDELGDFPEPAAEPEPVEANYMGSRVLVLRVARAGDVGYDPNQDKVVVRFEDGTEKAVLRGKLNDGSKAKTDLVGNPTVDEAGAQGVGRHDPVPA